MKRRFLSASVAGALLLPHLAFAATPSDLLRSAEFNGQPRDFRLQAHGNDGTTYFSMWLEGAVEGATPVALEATVKTTVDIHRAGVTTRSRYELLVTGQTAYFRLLTMENTPAGQPIAPDILEMREQWTSVPLATDDLTSGMSLIGGVSPLTLVEGIDTVGASLLNESFVVTSGSFTGGYTHKLALQPGFLIKSASLLQNAGIVPGGSQLQPEELLALEEQLGQSIDASVKIDTDLEGNFTFGRLWVSAAFGGFQLSFQSESWLRGAGIVVTAPASSQPISPMSDLPFSLPSVPGMEPTPTTSGSNSSRTSVSSRRTTQDTMSAECRAAAGTALGNQLIRKGVCPIAEDSRPRRGSQRQ
jgi:hypothetical protein